MTVSADALATELADMRRRLEALERSAQMSRTSIEGGALVVNDDAGSPVLTVGRQASGTYAVAALEGGQVIANTLDLPEGSITATDIQDGSISTPKLAANAITADKISADALDARTIRGNTIIGAQITGSTVTAGTGGEIVLDADGLFITNPDDNAQYIGLSYTDSEMGVGINLGPGLEHSGEFPSPLYAQAAAIHATVTGDYTDDPDGRYSPTLRIAAPYVWQYPKPPTGIAYSLMLLESGDDEGGDPKISLVTNIVDVYGRLVVSGRDVGKGLVASAMATSSSAAIGTTATVVNSTSVTLKAGRAYRLDFVTGLSSSAAGNLAFFAVYHGSKILGEGFRFRTEASPVMDGSFTRYIRNNTAADVTAALEIRLQASAGTVTAYANTGQPRGFVLHDVGLAADYSFATSV
ncbi:hypothetical protein GCM10010168_53190 [Actinoplanes ianthinogenes]|uniref:Uncharacterized protein n=1 Tax=Actinoplanes ianthinogenes TaxID=122358 RepID=A0ABN6C9I4_9ACTN|nr:hypothetical protein [Actinoplanes ianthinogenes]BCJ41683.1 hypothetical protein Aiant_23400 [Actinoplanes ianthinogenes]GGR28431.1 hypothetical protein GCM10010168_53190 [Actinoplanes ianthinogenes]